MRFWCTFTFAVLIFGLPSPSGQAPATGNDRWRDFALTYDGTQLSKFDYILDLGYIGIAGPDIRDRFKPQGTAQCKPGGSPELSVPTPDSPSEIALKVKYTGKQSTSVAAIAFGSRTSAHFGESNDGQMSTVSSGQNLGLIVRFVPGAGDPNLQDLNGVVLIDKNASPLLSITIDYLLLPNQLVRELLSGPLMSGPKGQRSGTLSADHRGYELETGPAPAGYLPNQVCYSVLFEQRSCGNWADCDAYQYDENNVGVAFRIQGMESRLKPLQGRVWMRVSYEPKRSKPVLR